MYLLGDLALILHGKVNELSYWRAWREYVSKSVQFLCNGIEDDMIMRLKAVHGREPSRPEALEAASGKLLLVRKLLTKLRSEKRRVLIFSQFKIMLDLLEEMIEEHLQMPYERLDGDTKGMLHQPNLSHS